VLPVGFVHEQVVAAELLLNPVLQLAVGGPSILVGSLVQGVAKFTGPLNDKNILLTVKQGYHMPFYFESNYDGY